MITPCVEKLLEANLIAAIEALNIADLEVVGTWNVAADETPSTKARLTVKVSPRGYSRFTISEAVFAATLELSVRVDTDRNGELLARASAEILGLLHAWNMNKANEAKTALAVDGVLSIGGIRVSNGNGPALERGIWYLDFPIEIVGFVKTTTNTQGE